MYMLMCTHSCPGFASCAPARAVASMCSSAVLAHMCGDKGEMLEWCLHGKDT